MASVSSTSSSLGNTSLRGYGGLASGIDRDSIIEQMTSGTQSKITKQEQKIEKLTWKQEAYQSISGQILDLADNYFSYTSTSTLKDSSVFAKNQITVQGDSDITKFISASGSSSMVDNLSILGVQQLATSTTLLSSKKGSDNGSIQTTITETSLTNEVYKSSNLQGTKLEFGYYGNEDKWHTQGTFKFPSTYTHQVDGKDVTETLDYTSMTDETKTEAERQAAGEELAGWLNKALEDAGIKNSDGETNISEVVEFKYSDGKLQLVEKEGKEGKFSLVINSSSSALKALGYNSDAEGNESSDGVSLKELKTDQKLYSETAVTSKNMIEMLAGKEFSISFAGQTKSVELVKKGETFKDLAELQTTIQERLDSAFGTGNIKVEKNSEGALKFSLGSNTSSTQTLVITTTDSELKKTLGLNQGTSTKLSTETSVKDNIDKLVEGASDEYKKQILKNLDENGLTINGVTIEGVTSDTTIEDMIDKINSTTEAGVKVSYLSSTNQFVMVSTETGSGREIALEGASLILFGAQIADGSFVDSRCIDKDGNIINTVNEDGTLKKVDSSTVKLADGSLTSGQNAKVLVSYGGSVSTMLESSSNSFDLEGMKVTVKGTFGNIQETNGTYTSDTSQSVTFSASADVEGITETVKKFFEEYNALVTEINKQATTKPTSGYDPLTDDQKAEMSETSIENWENKAKEGILYNDSIMRELSQDLQSVITQMLNSGMSYEDLEEMGITMSDDYLDGGTITFDEAKFTAALTEDPDKVANIFTGGGGVKTGLMDILEDTLEKYATRYKTSTGSYGLLIEQAGSEKVPLSVTDNEIYRQLKDMQEVLEKYKTQLETEQERYITQFTTMETSINKMNSQSSYLSQLTS